jgi:hypothetical protein
VKGFHHERDKMVQNLAKSQRLCEEIFQTLLANFVKGLTKSWLKFCPLCKDKSEQNQIKSSFMLKKAFFYQTPNGRNI